MFPGLGRASLSWELAHYTQVSESELELELDSSKFCTCHLKPESQCCLLQNCRPKFSFDFPGQNPKWYYLRLHLYPSECLLCGGALWWSSVVGPCPVVELHCPEVVLVACIAPRWSYTLMTMVGLHCPVVELHSPLTSIKGL